MAEAPLVSTLRMQGRVCGAFGSAFYAGLLEHAAADLPDAARALFSPWDGLSSNALMQAAVALRFLAALHDLALSGDEPALTLAFPPANDPEAAWRAAVTTRLRPAFPASSCWASLSCCRRATHAS